MNKILKKTILKGDVSIPPSKSDTQRALICAALSTGISVIYNIGKSDDEKSMLNNISILGAEIEYISENTLKIKGIEKIPEFLEFNVGESGLGLRLLGGLCATQKGIHHIYGKGSLINRDQSFFEKYLTKYGIEISSNSGKVPLVFKGYINKDQIEVEGSLSSQYISGLLIGLSLSNSLKEIRVNNLNSIPYINMTINTMREFGINIENKSHKIFKINSSQNFKSCEYHVESDWSSASFWLVAAAIGHDIRICGLDHKSKQADIYLLEALKLAGCNINYNIDSYSIDALDLKSFNFDATHCPDLFPALVVLASKCNGKSQIKGVSRLLNKESNRANVIKDEFGKIGVDIELDGDNMIVIGNSILNSAVVDSKNDHRIAMSLAIIGTTIEGGIEIQNAEAVTKSYPEFWNDLEQVS